jgi:hypothetical protein
MPVMAESNWPRAPGVRDAFRCRVCDRLLELFDGFREVALRLTIEPEKRWDMDAFFN